MKIRSDYVSNSSSSSFILGHHEMFDFFNITKQDILDALIDAYGGKDLYESRKQSIIDSMNDHKEYYEKNIKYNDFGPIFIYDLNDENDKKQAIDMWGDLLKDWDANHCSIGNDGEVTCNGHSSQHYDAILTKLYDIYGVMEYELRDISIHNTIPNKFIRSNEKDPNTGFYGHYEPLDKEVVDFVNNLRKTCGIMTNLDALKCSLSRFFIHADDNELPMGSYDDDKDFESESYSYDRVCEIILKYLIKVGKVRPNDEDFLNEMAVDPKYLTKWEIKDGLLWSFYNGNSLTWQDLKQNSLTWNMHEG